MVYEKEEILQYIIEEDVKFIRMTFCDVTGRLKNVSIMPDELDRAFDYGIAIDASAVAGFGGEVYSDLVLRPDASTLLHPAVETRARARGAHVLLGPLPRRAPV